MQRSRLKNIVNKSKGFSKPIGEPFDNFKATLPNEVDENYRLEAAWKAYGSPKDFKEAVWNGMIQPIDENTYKFPSIGYNEETDEYEYLNKGKENETVAKDIRVWDNDVIPLVKELKQGGYIRVYNDEKDCWTYSKNKEINSFKEGGKTQLITLLEANKSKAPFMVRLLTNDTRSIQLPNEKYPSTHLLCWDEIDGKTYIYPHIQPDENGNLKFYDKDALNRALETGDYLESDPENAKWFTENYKNYYPSFFNKFENGGELEAFKQGGQMNVIPEGALHARKNNMELAKEGEITHKGIPVVDNNGVQQAEVEKEELTVTKEVTDKLENWYKKFYDENTSEKEKDELAIKCGKFFTKEILFNTEDRVNLISKIEEDME